MTLTNLQIQIRNFKSIEQTDWILLDGKIEVLGKNLIDGGSNGSGKSSIIEALYVAVNLCDMKDNSDYKKELKKYCKNQKLPFEIHIKFSVQNVEHEIMATPDGIKRGTIEAKGHLFRLITSFLMQGMSNSLIKQDASDCKAIISSYFECDLIIENITQNAAIVRSKLEDKIQLLKVQEGRLLKSIDMATSCIETDEANLQLLLAEENDIALRVGSDEEIYHEDVHAQLQIDIENTDEVIRRLDDEIGRLYQNKATLSNGVEFRVKELKKQKDKFIEDAISLYSRTIGNKFVSFVKKEVKEYNETQQKEIAIKNMVSQEDKLRRIEEITSKLDEIERLESPKMLISDTQRNGILTQSNKFIKVVSKDITVAAIKKESKTYYDGILNTVKTNTDDQKEKLEKELISIRKSPVKSFKEVEVSVYTVKNKPKRNLPKYYVVYNCSTDDNLHSIIENNTMLDLVGLKHTLSQMDNYQPPDTSGLDREISELENTDIVQRISFIDQEITTKQSEKVTKTDQVREYREEDRKLQERKFKSELFAKDKIKLITLRSNVSTIKQRIHEQQFDLEHFEKTLTETQKNVVRWSEFLADIVKDSRLVQNSFKDYIIDMYNDRIEPLIGFYSNKVFAFNSKLLVKIGNKTKQPTLNGIKFDYTSGGEKSKAMFVFSLAHRDYLAKQRGFSNDYIFCDEVFDGMDESSRQQSIEFLSQAIDMKNILIISHMEERTLPNFRKITITKSDSGSIVE